jgi:hypothetical protein
MATRQVSRGRRRAGNILAAVVVLVLGVSVWQTWDQWRERLFGEDRRGPRDGRRFGPGPGVYGRPGFPSPEAEGLDWELADRVRVALEIRDAAEWQALEPKLARVVRLRQQLPEGKDLLDPGAAGPAAATTGPAATEETAAVRADRARLRLQLKRAQDELRKSVTRRQEAALVLLGLID